MSFQLTDEQRQVVATVRADIGISGLTVPKEYGDSGLPVFETARRLSE